METSSLPGAESSTRFHRLARILFGCATLLSGLLQAWAWRYAVNSDGISYLDIADMYLRHNWRAAVNAYWSPLYSIILAVGFQVFHPNATWEAAWVHGINLLILFFAAACFEFLLGQMVDCLHTAADPAFNFPLPAWALRTLGYVLFLWTTLKFTPVSLVTPDLLVTAFIFLAAGVLLRMKTGRVTIANCFALGGILGLAYLSKTIMLPIGVVFLASGLIWIPGLRKSFPRFLTAVLTFVLVCAPFVAAISRAKGHLTIGDSGKINYAEYVDGAGEFVHWQGEGAAGTPLHPTRKLNDNPPIYEFAAPIAGSYPPWFDPSYWYDGVAPRFNVVGQWNVLGESYHAYTKILGEMKGWLLVLMALVLAGSGVRSFFRRLLDQGSLLLPSLAALTLYALVHVTMRYVGGFMSLLWLGCFAALRFREHNASKALVKCLVIAVTIVYGAEIAAIDANNLIRSFLPRPHVAWQVADGLHRMGIHPGEKVASIGYALGVYWPRLTGVKVVVEIPAQGEAAFWEATPDIQQQVMRTFAKTGATVVVTYLRGKSDPPVGWQAIGPTGYFVHRLTGP